MLLRGGGSSFAAPLFQSLDRRLPQGAAGARRRVRLRSAAARASSRFVTGSLDFGGTDAPLTAAQVAQVEGGALQLPTAAGMIAICYNLPGFAGELRLPREVYAGIFDGTITRLERRADRGRQPGPRRCPGAPSPLSSRRDGSGTTFAFTNHLQAIDPIWREQKRGAATRVDWPGGGHDRARQRRRRRPIKNSDYSIGYVEYGFAKRLGLNMAVLENRDGAVRRPGPGRRTGGACQRARRPWTTIWCAWSAIPAGAASYPVVTLTWALVNQHYADPRKAAAVRAFLGWGLGEGQAVARAAGLRPPRRRPHGGEPGVAATVQ